MRAKSVFVVSAIVLFLAASSARATEYSALPFSAKVVDGDTGRPIEGAVAFVIWDLNYSNGFPAPGVLYSHEEVTGVDGVFHMPGWGPLKVGGEALSAPIVIDPAQPGLYVFAPRYELYVGSGEEDNSYIGNILWKGDLVRKVWADHATVRLRRATENESYLRVFSLGGVGLWSDCLWAKNPRMAAALVKESKRLVAAHPDFKWPFRWARFESESANECGDPRTVLGPYLR